MGYQTLIVDQSGAIATITLNRPDARNALDFVMRRELLDALDEIEANPAARVVILTGAGGHFCAGGDVKNMRQRSIAADGQVRLGLLNRAVLRFVNFPLPTIAMVDGYAVGAVLGDLSSRPRRRRGRARSTESPAAPADGAGRWWPAAAALAGARPPDPASTGASRW